MPGELIRLALEQGLSASFVGYAMVMLLVERKMRRTGGPGIIPFELAGHSAAAEAIMARWGVEGRRAARLSLVLDFGYMLNYGFLIGLLLDRTARRNRHRRAVPVLVVAAVVSDAVEGISLLRVLDHRNVEQNASRAKNAALTKFALLGTCAGYLAKFGIVRTWTRRREAKRPNPRGTVA